jgi:hypothetical protein
MKKGHIDSIIGRTMSLDPSPFRQESVIMRRHLFGLGNEHARRIEPQRIESHLSSDIRTVERTDDRRVISGVMHGLKSG